MKSADEFDAVVIGSGPTGSTAAKVLAEGGARVLLTERCKLPRYKSCSGMLIKKTVDLVREIFGEEVPRSVMCTPVENHGMVLTDDKGCATAFCQQGWNVWRSAFDCCLARLAEKSGAVIRDETVALSCEQSESGVTLALRGRTDTEVRAAYIIDCEGVVGSFKRKLLPQNSGYITTFQTFNDASVDLDPHLFYAYLQPELSEYDAWFNVKDDTVVLGVSAKNPERIPAYYATFLRYMEQNHGLRIRKRIREEKWLMPRILPDYPIDYGMGRVLFAGEIAGFLNPMGEGISAGIESGRAAANAVLQYFADPAAVLRQYRAETTDLRNYMKRQWSLAARLSDAFDEMKSE